MKIFKHIPKRLTGNKTYHVDIIYDYKIYNKFRCTKDIFKLNNIENWNGKIFNNMNFTTNLN
jgi:hypothetical protein